MTSGGEARGSELLEGYFGTRRIRTSRRLKIPKLLREGDLLSQHETLEPEDSVYWGVVDESPVFAREKRYLASSWMEIKDISLDDLTAINDDETIPVAGRFFPDYTPPGYAHLAPELQPDSVPQPAQLKQGDRLHFVRWWNQALLDKDESSVNPGYVYQLLTWDELYKLEEEIFARLFPTYAQWSVLLDNITYDETMDNPGVPGQVLDRAMKVFDHTRDGPSG